MNHLSPEILGSIAEGGAPSPDQSAHMQSCRDCARTVEAFRNYFAAMKSLPALKAPPGFSARVRARLEAEAAEPAWKKFLSTLFTIRRIPLQLAGAGFAALLLFWALPRYQNLVPQSETGAAKNRAAPAPTVAENVTIDEVQPAKEAQAGEEKISRPEPPRPPLPSDLAAKKSVAKPGAGSRTAAGRGEPAMESDRKPPPWSKADDLAMIEVNEASAPKPVKTELPASVPDPAASAPAKDAPMARKRAAAQPSYESESATSPASPRAAGAAGAVSRAEPKAESKAKAAQDLSLALKSEESAPAAATQPPTTDSLLRAMGFHRENRRGLSVQILHVSKAESDSVQLQLRELGMEKLLILHPLGGDSLEIEIR